MLAGLFWSATCAVASREGCCDGCSCRAVPPPPLFLAPVAKAKQNGAVYSFMYFCVVLLFCFRPSSASIFSFYLLSMLVVLLYLWSMLVATSGGQLRWRDYSSLFLVSDLQFYVLRKCLFEEPPPPFPRLPRQFVHLPPPVLAGRRGQPRGRPYEGCHADDAVVLVAGERRRGRRRGRLNQRT